VQLSKIVIYVNHDIDSYILILISIIVQV